MKTLFTAAAFGLMMTTTAFAGGINLGDTTNNTAVSGSTSGAAASVKANQTAILNQRQLQLLNSRNQATGGSTGGVSTTVQTDGDDMFSSIAFSVGYSSSAVPSDGYKGVKNYGLTSIFGGVQIPAEIDDTTKAYQNLGAGIVKVWFDPDPKIDPKQRLFEKSLICNMVHGVKDAVEDAGQTCPSS